MKPSNQDVMPSSRNPIQRPPKYETEMIAVSCCTQHNHESATVRHLFVAELSICSKVLEMCLTVLVLGTDT
jgi:hypothetical protein